ncbi:MAG: DUF3572 domain-containing protein [Alphaproteobacteria bacterium]
MAPATLGETEAAAVALQGLAYVAGEPALLQRLLDSSGISLEELRHRADEPALLGGVLDFLLADESALLVFCESHGLAPDLPARARLALPGALAHE